MPPLEWTAWRPISGSPVLAPHVLAELLDGGQAFRWRPEPGGLWRGQWLDYLVRLRVSARAGLEYQATGPRAKEAEAELQRYLALGDDLDKQLDRLPWRSDPVLAESLQAFPGLRILRQPFGETLLGFLCSATKQIVQIRQMMDALAQRLGQPLGGGFYRLPTWPELAAVPERELRACALGFRAKYIHETAAWLALYPSWLDETAALPYAEAKERLCGLPGVGEKVADCVLLFGAGRDEAFPVDTWIMRILAEHYGLKDWSPAQLAQFGRVHFGAAAGLAQQYLFAWVRSRGRT